MHSFTYDCFIRFLTENYGCSSEWVDLRYPPVTTTIITCPLRKNVIYLTISDFCIDFDGVGLHLNKLKLSLHPMELVRLANNRDDCFCT